MNFSIWLQNALFGGRGCRAPSFNMPSKIFLYPLSTAFSIHFKADTLTELQTDGLTVASKSR